MTKVKIKENSFIARIAAYKLNSDSVAMVIGKTIYLHNSSREEFLNNERWVRHEVAHVKQYGQLGLFRFLALYLLETFNKGYQNNRFEVDARQKEKDISVLSEIYFG
ncbi:DUF4157 domain-containing protein [Segetibacter koreensis]|uniref:DUF4157 domain-containing protein n=1 Tax=Segetibacter koreensis TaxID=398037 RepID=UPI00037DA172|nr:DUF4157 domain-containing protein [Segetibacter koreensis]